MEAASLELNVLSTSFTTFAQELIMEIKSDFILSSEKYLTPRMVEDRQYAHLKGQPLETS